MSNIVSIGLPKRPSLSQRQGALLQSFAHHRRAPDDVYWLKENAEILNILAASGARIAPHDLAAYHNFYATIEDRMRFFPQYYRFLLSICLDLEDLGMEGDTGRTLCRAVRDAKLIAGEMSDLQRAEGLRLLARREVIAPPCEVTPRLLAFMAQTRTFALPNKKAAYELTHVVFYLSDYGKRPLPLSDAALTSLDYAGLLAFLDQDIDLLAEVCIALRFAGRTPSEIWENWLAQEVGRFRLTAAPDGASQDCYHEYLVSNWWSSLVGVEGFRGALSIRGGVTISRVGQSQGLLRTISEVMYQLGPARSGSWDQMRGILERSIGPDHQQILGEASQSSTRFNAFFKEFARA